MYIILHTRQMLWYDDPYDEFNETEFSISSQYVSAHFTDIEQDVEKIGEKITDVKLPYERMYATQGEWITPANNHMVGCLSYLDSLLMCGCRFRFTGRHEYRRNFPSLQLHCASFLVFRHV